MVQAKEGKNDHYPRAVVAKVRVEYKHVGVKKTTWDWDEMGKQLNEGGERCDLLRNEIRKKGLKKDAN